jgi:amino acid permease
VSFAFGPLAYLSKFTSCYTSYIAHPLGLGSGGPSQAFAWILALSTVAGLLAWMTLCICYLRFYAACKAQGLDRNTLPFKSRLQPYAGWVGAIGSLSTFLMTQRSASDHQSSLCSLAFRSFSKASGRRQISLLATLVSPFTLCHSWSGSLSSEQK